MCSAGNLWFYQTFINLILPIIYSVYSQRNCILLPLSWQGKYCSPPPGRNSLSNSCNSWHGCSFTDSNQNEPISNDNVNNSTNVALSSWGEGVVGTSTHSLQDKGVVRSRGVDYDVVTSKELYPQLNKNQQQKDKDYSYAVVTSLQPYDAATVIQK